MRGSYAAVVGLGRRRSWAQDLEALATAARERMVERLKLAGHSASTLGAIERVPRHRLVPEFWSHRAGVGLVDHQRVGTDKGALDQLYDEAKPVGLQDPRTLGRSITSTASAPQVLAAQADYLSLERGMSVLEIGTGPGYFAALLAELVGRTGRVVTVDIDAEIGRQAARLLGECGYSNVEVMIGDADSAVQGTGPFDRVVASVGCADVAPVWLREMSPDGQALIPVTHGGSDPSLHLDAAGVGGVALWSGYVPIQGVQSAAGPWPHRRTSAPVDRDEPLLGELSEALATAGPFDFAFWVALCDPRASGTGGLSDGMGSAATISARPSKLAWGGPRGIELAEALRAQAHGWIAAGAPTTSDFSIRFVPRGAGAPALPAPPTGKSPMWKISRRDHDELVALERGLPRTIGNAAD